MTPAARPGGRPRVAVIGGGFGGIAAAARLRRAGYRDFVVHERSGSVGGTWWDNHYPGAETDAPAHLYCFSFAPYPWTRTHAGGAEVQRYLEHVVDRFDLRRHFRFGVGITSLTWDDRTGEWVLALSDGTEARYHAVISAVGMFGARRRPDLPGLTEFTGRVAHTAEWDDTIELAGARVAVVGTGSSASQVVPAAAPTAARVTVFQRQPAWLLPKNDRDLTRLERVGYRVPGLWKLHRLFLYVRQDRREVGGRLFRPGSRVNTATRRRAEANLDRLFGDRPDLRAALTPGYAFGGKRALLSSAFYESLLADNVELVPRAVASCTPTGVVDTAGVERPADVLVLATGFTASAYLAGLDVVGRDGRKLHEVWNGEPFALLGLTVPGFPNFFMLYGPNTNGGLIVSNLQRQAAYAVAEIGRLGRRGVVSVEPRADVVAWYNRLLQRLIAGTSFTATDNYFTAGSGRVVTQWPDGASTYALLTLLLRRPSTWGRRRRRG